MSDTPRTLERWVFGGLALVVAVILVAFLRQRPSRGPEPPTELGPVSSFSLTNQAGQVLRSEDLRGSVWLADIIFTRCAGPCPKLSRLFNELNRTLQTEPRVRFVSLTADPGYDTPEVLSRYGEQYGAVPGRWDLLTGEKPEVYRVATEGLKLAVLEKPVEEQENPQDLFIHSTVLTLVDGEGRIRGFFEGLEPGSASRIVQSVRALLAEK